MILLIENFTKHGQQLLKAYGKVLKKHRYGNLRLFFLCYRSNGRWFEELLDGTTTLNRREAGLRVRGCISGRVATAIVIFGAKKQLVLFPEEFEVVRNLCEDEEGREGSEEESSIRKEAVTGKSTGIDSKSVGKILGNTLGYESSDEDESSGENSGHLERQYEPYGEGLQAHVKSRNEHTHPLGGHAHRPCPPTVEQSHLALVEQVCDGFENWCDRLADGSLRRHSVEAWPPWVDS